MDSAKKRERLQEFETLFRQNRLSLTVQRRAILEVVLDRDDHPTAEQVYDEIRRTIPDISRTTVYRVLDTLTDIGVITKACSPGAATRFDPRTERHHHLVCLRCDKLIDVEDRSLDKRVRIPDVGHHSFRIQDFSIHFYGTCAACRRKLRSRKTTRPEPPSRASKRTVKHGRESRITKRRKRP